MSGFKKYYYNYLERLCVHLWNILNELQRQQSYFEILVHQGNIWSFDVDGKWIKWGAFVISFSSFLFVSTMRLHCKYFLFNAFIITVLKWSITPQLSHGVINYSGGQQKLHRSLATNYPGAYAGRFLAPIRNKIAIQPHLRIPTYPSCIGSAPERENIWQQGLIFLASIVYSGDRIKYNWPRV